MSKEELDIKQLRNDLQFTQEQFAKELGISRRTLIEIERTGKCSEAIKFRLLRFAKTRKPDCMMDCVIDYLRIRFETHDVEQIISKVLLLKIEYMSQQDTRFYGYKGLYAFDLIKVMYSEEEDSRGTLIELSGQGCRQFEALLEAQGRTWFDFLDCCELHKGRATRLDLAINDYVRLLDLPKLFDKIQADECITRFLVFDHQGGGKIVGGQIEGITIYIGSRKSDFYLCFYEKDYEQAKKYNVSPKAIEVKNRYEIRLKDERARAGIAGLRQTKSAKNIALGILSGHLRFVDKDKNKDKSEWKTNKDWEHFLGEVNKIKLVTKSSKDFYVKTREWLRKYCMSTVKMIKTADRLLNRNDFYQMLKEAELSEKHVNMLKVVTGKPEEMILSKVEK